MKAKKITNLSRMVSIFIFLGMLLVFIIEFSNFCQKKENDSKKKLLNNLVSGSFLLFLAATIIVKKEQSITWGEYFIANNISSILKKIQKTCFFWKTLTVNPGNKFNTRKNER